MSEIVIFKFNFSITELSKILSNSASSVHATVSESLLKIDGHNKVIISSSFTKSGLESNFLSSSLYNAIFSCFVAIT